MKPRWLPHPAISALIALAWLMLQESLSPANVIAAAAFGIALPWLVDGLLGEAPRPRRPGVALRLTVTVLLDIVRANVTVARIVLGPMERPRPAWLQVPLELRHPSAVALLATIVTNTPGTVSCRIDEERRVLHVHALDAADPAAVVHEIKQRYERPLMEIFE